jgi:hypothetical protein
VNDGNTISAMALLLALPLTAVAFAVTRPQVAVPLTLISATLLLPERVAFDPEGLPRLDKYTLTVLCVFVACMITAGRRLASARPGRGVDLLVIALMMGGAATAITNGDTLEYGSTTLSALTIRDAVSLVVRDLLWLGFPFFLGRALFRDPRDLRVLLQLLVGAALIYSLPILMEIRLSPQLHRWVYGFHQHEFAQAVRGSGYRPMVFMPHGLAVALFMCSATICAAGLTRIRARIVGIPALVATVYLAAIMLLCKSLAAAVYTLVFVPLAMYASTRTQRLALVVLVLLVGTYPLLRGADLFPTEPVLEAARAVSAERAASVQFRFDNEDQLAMRARERALFGWGGFGRGRIFDESGRDISVTDGHWVITLSSRGYVGFLTTFGLLLYPVALCALRLSRVRNRRERAALCALCFGVVAYVVDLLPNGMFTNLVWLLAGALVGLTRRLGAGRRSQALAHPARD